MVDIWLGILEVVPAICSWIKTILANEVVPTFTWDIDASTGQITVTLDEHGLVYDANVYYAYSCGNNVADGVKRRDYRIASLDDPCSCGFSSDGYCANIKSFWSRTRLESTTVRGHRVYTAQLDAPEDGRYVAYFIDIKYRKNKDDMLVEGMARNEERLDGIFDKEHGFFPKDLAGRLEFTTEVSVWPNTFPYEDCSGVGCTGTLL